MLQFPAQNDLRNASTILLSKRFQKRMLQRKTSAKRAPRFHDNLVFFAKQEGFFLQKSRIDLNLIHSGNHFHIHQCMQMMREEI